jgi:hypothetical protein|tara:strand:+ start:142 stop:480 length:339 start_codon:yes stop_codon:yes gene_type:complete
MFKTIRIISNKAKPNHTTMDPKAYAPLLPWNEFINDDREDKGPKEARLVVLLGPGNQVFARTGGRHYHHADLAGFISQQFERKETLAFYMNALAIYGEHARACREGLASRNN